MLATVFGFALIAAIATSIANSLLVLDIKNTPFQQYFIMLEELKK
nr:MAG TPA: hypothetical protein [Caudoviricetes sp.]